MSVVPLRAELAAEERSLRTEIDSLGMAYGLGFVASNSLAYIEMFDDDAVERYRVDCEPVDLSKVLTIAVDTFKHEKKENGEQIADLIAVHIDKDSPYGDVARYHEARIFKQEWYKEMDPETYAVTLEHEFGSYENASRFLLVLDTSQRDDRGVYRVAGVSRMIDGAEAPLKTIEDMKSIWKKDELETLEDIKQTMCDDWFALSESQRALCGDPAFTWDISSLAVDKDYRNESANVYAILSQAMHTWARKEGVQTWTTVFVTKFFRLYTKMYGTPFRAIANAEPREHMGADSVPAVMHLNELPAMLIHPTIKRGTTGYGMLILGEGLDYTPVSL